MLAHCNFKKNMCLCSKQSSLFSFYALPSGGKLKDVVVHSIKHFFGIPDLTESYVKQLLYVNFTEN